MGKGWDAVFADIVDEEEEVEGFDGGAEDKGIFGREVVEVSAQGSGGESGDESY